MADDEPNFTMQEREERRWKWQSTGAGWILYQGSKMGFFVDEREFDENGAQLRERIATLLNGDEEL